MNLIQSLLLAVPPEAAHSFAMTALGAARFLPGPVSPILGRQRPFLGKTLLNPIGLAAGLDKNAEAVLGLARCGFGFLEVGTVTPLAQPGNPKPRLFRLPEHQALINRMGFNNRGMQAMAKELHQVRQSGRLSKTLLGVNLGKNKDTPNEQAASDYRKGMDCLHSFADYFTINLSSPNTPGLRQLQHGEALKALLSRVKERQLGLASQSDPVPLMLKVAPDLADEEIEQIAEQASACEFDGVIATNTTLSREAVAGHKHAEEAGGLSGSPLTGRSLSVVSQFRRVLPANMAIVGVGGIGDDHDARAMLAAGADALQIYTSFIYKGTNLVQNLVEKTK
ncbi:MAG: quinone-dependent dihydroorotate dehydrogenase [Gammaproteobacteria bacterium]|jgi:dihydroorotate dehydrogenase